jgi:hypothetical protein
VDVPKLLQDRSKPAEFAVMERTRIANCTNEFRPELSFVSSLRYKIKHVQIRSLTGSDRFRRFKRSATDLTFFGQGSLTLTTLAWMELDFREPNASIDAPWPKVGHPSSSPLDDISS